jgi:hypothetical protein
MLSPHARRSTRVYTSEDLQDLLANGPSHLAKFVSGCFESGFFSEEMLWRTTSGALM